jgi:soluble lytic murein transglycosylase-like protein
MIKLIIVSILGAVFLQSHADLNQNPELGRVNQALRSDYAQHVLGETEFHRLADELALNTQLETFIYKKVERSFAHISPMKAQHITNAIIRESNRSKLDPMFVLAIIEQESHFNPETLGSHGEIGLMQVMPKTAFWIAKKNNIPFSQKKQLLDPIMNIRIGVHYLAWLNKRFDDARHSTSAYNMGPKNVRKILRNNKQPEVYYTSVLGRYKKLYSEARLVLPESSKSLADFLIAADN